MFDTRKTVDQTQLGLVYERRLDAVNSLRALVYGGHRNTEQFQAIPVAPAGQPAPSGRRDRARPRLQRHRPALERQDAPRRRAVHARRRHRLRHARRAPARLPELHRPDARRRGRAAPRREQRRLELRPVRAGVVAARRALDRARRHPPQQRALLVRRPLHRRHQSRRQRAAALRRDAAGRRRHVRGDRSDVHLYATAGRGFETPTLNELAYRPNGATGLNLALGAATSDSYEAGVKTRSDLGRGQRRRLRDANRRTRSRR